MLIADLHIHSKYSRATSKDCTPEYLDLWARRKGIQIIGTGDFTHPVWRKELEEKLSPCEEGLYILKKEYRIFDDTAPDNAPRFVISGEISSIYKKNGKVRKVHNLILLPGLEAAQVLSVRLEAIGNLHSDGRPILGLDSRDLLEITLDVCPEAVFIPAHIWTPHFSLFGAFSGFDTIEECFEDLTPYIHALETGLSSDPSMNWRLKALDSYNLVSNSDAHSPSKLGREASLLDIEYSYSQLSKALAGGAGFKGTIEFFPEEGKYHLDGHRKCSLCLTPSQTLEYNGRCPVCGRKITIGVLHRVEELADREDGIVLPQKPPFESLVPLQETIAGSIGRTPSSAKVTAMYMEMLRNLGPEFFILREAPIDAIQQIAGPCVSEGIKRLRKGEVRRIPGYDGEYGTIQLIQKEEIEALNGQMSLFGLPSGSVAEREPAYKRSLSTSIPPSSNSSSSSVEISSPLKEAEREDANQEQLEAIQSPEPYIAVIAGPGTGKTKTLILRILYLLTVRKVKPSEITAVTFTKKAALELEKRLAEQLGGKSKMRFITIGTFHSICRNLLSSWNFPHSLADEYEILDIAEETVEKFRDSGLKISAKKLLQEISAYKNSLSPSKEVSPEFLSAFEFYENRLLELKLMDFDDLLIKVLSQMEHKREEKSKDLKRFHYLLLDEFQDINELQYHLIQSWNKKGKSLFAIGDPDQSIYGFRGSNSQCFKRLKEDFESIKLISLIKNYRSTPQILSCAQPLIEKNGSGLRCLQSEKKAGPVPMLVTADTLMSEGIFIAKEISRLAGGIDMLDAQNTDTLSGSGSLRGFSDIAVLYRTHRQAELLGHCLAKEGIPYTVTGKEDYLMDKTIRGTISFFRFLLAPEDLLSGKTFLKYICHWDEDKIQAFLIIWKLYVKTALDDAVLEQIAVHLQKENLDSGIIKLFQYFLSKLSKVTPDKILKEWCQKLNISETKPLEKLFHTLIFHKRMKDFLDTLTLGQEGDLKRSSGRVYSSDSVSLMTFHGSKGLEFPVVFLAGINDKIIPLSQNTGSVDLEEERRLLYVGITRAKEELIIITSPQPSLFLMDIPKECVVNAKAHREKPLPEAIQLSLFDYL